MINKSIICASISLLLILTGCATHIPNNIEGKTELDTTKIIRIENFQYNPKGAINLNTFAIENLNIELSENISIELKKIGLHPVMATENTKEYDGYIIKGRILEVNGGSGAQRIWLGFGAGATTVTVRGEIIDAKSATQLRNFTLTKQSNWTYSNNETAVRENINEIAVEIAKYFKKTEWEKA